MKKINFISFLFCIQGIDKEDNLIYIRLVKIDNILGDNDEEGTPVPIPNTAVKLFDAENT